MKDDIMTEAAIAALQIHDGDEEKEDTSSAQMAQREALDLMFEQVSKKKLQELELIVMPTELTNVKLYDHQVQGISWLYHNETSNELPAWWQRREHDSGKVSYKCSITRQVQSAEPTRVKGSILADDMGLGKTVQAIGLVLANRGTGCTLIVSPVSVMANWDLQIQEFAPHLRVDRFYGPNRSQVLDEIDELDVVLTSYHTLVSELKSMLEHHEKVEENEEREKQGKRRKHKIHERFFLFDVPWFRVVLDEAHEIRNPQTWFFQAVSTLDTQHKLCLTGTPFVNRPADIGSLLKFLELDPLGDLDVFERTVTEPIKNFKEVGLARLRTIMAHVALRRNKSIVESNLTNKSIQFVKVALVDGQHKDTLHILFETTRTCIIELLRMGRVGRKLGAIFGLLLHVRQACCDVRLISADRRRIILDVAQSMKEIDDFDSDQGMALLEKLIGDLRETQGRNDFLASSSDEESFYSEDEGESLASSSDDDSDMAAGGPTCEVCLELLNEDNAVVVRSCQHVFCEDCLDPSGGQICPECRTPYEMDDLSRQISTTTPMKKPKTPMKSRRMRPLVLEKKVVIDMEQQDAGRSPKVQALLDEIAKMAPEEKGVIFSQWTSFLDIIQRELKAEGHTMTRIDGSMSAIHRLDAMKKFSTDGCDSSKTPRFVLCSLRACGTGINLTRANVVFLCDPYWNLAAEEQAMDRVHRISQKRDVRVLRLVMTDSIEERMVQLQDSKAALGKGSLHKITQQERKKAKLTFLRDLFDIQESMWDTDALGGDFIVDDDDVWSDGEDEPWI